MVDQLIVTVAVASVDSFCLLITVYVPVENPGRTTPALSFTNIESISLQLPAPETCPKVN